MSKFCPLPKNCQIKSQSQDYFANKVPLNLRGWVPVSVIGLRPKHTQKNEQCSPAERMQIFRRKSKKVTWAFFYKKGVYFGSKVLFCQGETLS